MPCKDNRVNKIVSVTISDIAKKLNLHHTTVSRVLNNRGKDFISEKTRDKVLAAAKELGYQPNLFARGLITGKSHMIGVNLGVPNVEVTANRLMIFETLAYEHGYSIVSAYHGGDPAREQANVQRLKGLQIDGMLAIPTEHSECMNYKNLAEQGFPLVIMGQNPPFPVNSVDSDSVEGGRLVVQHLIEQGRRNIAFICGSKDKFSAAIQGRIEGYKLACNSAGIDFESLPFFATKNPTGTVEAGRDVAVELVNSGRKFDAVVASSDIFAIVACKVLKDSGYRIPQDVAVTGCDDISVAQYLSVPLTTLRTPHEEDGKTAFNMLLTMMDRKDRKEGTGTFERVLVKPQLVIRESTACCQ